MSAAPKLPLTNEEKLKLRKAKVKMKEIHQFTEEQLAEILTISVDKAKIIKGLADFQSVPSIGNKLAEKIVYQLNICSLSDIKEKDGAQLFDELETKLGVWTDSCVEDQIRCVIHYANNPRSDKQWFDFTEERKAYRQRVGFPKDRPKTAWYE